MLLRKENVKTISSSCLYVDAIFCVLLFVVSQCGKRASLEPRDKQEVKESILSTKTRRIIFQEYYSKKKEVISGKQLLNTFRLLLALIKLKSNLQKNKLTS